MQEVILILHILLAIVMVILILLQRSEGGALGIGGGGGGVGGLMSSRGAANLLTRSTAILAGLFFLTSIVLTVLSKGSTETKSVLDTAAPQAQTQQAPVPAANGEKPLLDTALPKSAPESGAASSETPAPDASKGSSDEPQVPIAK